MTVIESSDPSFTSASFPGDIISSEMLTLSVHVFIYSRSLASKQDGLGVDKRAMFVMDTRGAFV